LRFVIPPEFAGPFKLRRKYFRRAKLRGLRARRGLGKFRAETGEAASGKIACETSGGR